MVDPSRRRFMQKVGLGTTAFMLSGITPFERLVFAREPVYKGVTYLPPAYRAIRYGIDGFIEELRQQAPESMEIEFFDSGTLMKADAQLPGLKEGAIQFMFHSTTYISRYYPILGITGLPGICEHLYEHGERVAMESPLWNLINDELAKDNLFMLTVGGGLVEPEYIWSKEKKITRMTELKGSRCRVVGYEATEFLKSFGAMPIRIPSSQTYLALQRGLLDTALAPINTVIARNLQEHLKFCFKLPVTAVGVAIFLLKSTWDKMPAAEKDALWEAGQWYDRHQAKIGYKKIPQEEYWPIVKNAGIEISHPLPEEQDIFLRQAKLIWEWWKNQVNGQVGRKAIDLARGKK